MHVWVGGQISAALETGSVVHMSSVCVCECVCMCVCVSVCV